MYTQNACVNMIKQQLRTGNVLSEHILSLYEEIPRIDFIPEPMKPFAYSDMQIPLSEGQRMLAPLEEGTILQALNLKGNETVLEIGTGSGFMTSLLSRLSKKVISLDYFEEFTIAAKRKLEQYQCDNVELITFDACRGFLEKAPYDVIIITAAIEKITETLRLQVVPGGQLVAIVGKEPIMHCMQYNLDHQNSWTETFLFETAIPALIDQSVQTKFVF
jgi:protein-L-isoaspartate(D-aspartate) O-methyltransferase